MTYDDIAYAVTSNSGGRYYSRYNGYNYTNSVSAACALDDGRNRYLLQLHLKKLLSALLTGIDPGVGFIPGYTYMFSSAKVSR